MSFDSAGFADSFDVAIWLAANRGSTAELVEYLRSDRELTREHRLALARYLAGEMRRPRGRPRRRATDFLRRPPNPIKVAAIYAERYLSVWRRRYGLNRYFERPDGTRVPIVVEASRQGAERVKRISGGSYTPDPDAVYELMRRPKSRRSL